MNTQLADELAKALGIRTQTIAPTTEPTPRKVVVADSNPGTLGGNVEKLILQFSFIPDCLVPGVTPREEDETCEKRADRKALPLSVPGIQFIPNTKYTDGTGLRQLLVDEGFTLVDCYVRERIDGATGKVGYHMVRFTFYRTVRDVSDTYREILEQEIGPALDAMLARSLWRVRAYNNPLVRQGVVVEGTRSISVNLEFPEKPGRENTKVLTIRNHRLIIC